MASMDIHKRHAASRTFIEKSCLLAVLCAWGFSDSALAFDWRARPSLSFSEMFSDNLTLSDSAKKSGFVTEVAPGISIFGSSPWSNFNMNYRMQGLYNAGGRDAFDINHQLQMNSLFQPVRNTFFVQTGASIRQQNISNTFIATDNLTGNSPRVNAKNFSISPYWTPHFGQYANGLFKVGYQKSSFDNANSSPDNTVIPISDSETFSRQARLSSGSKFNIFRWNLNYFSENQTRTFGQDVRFENYQGEGRYYFSRKYNVFLQGGYENNDFQGLNNRTNGFFYTFGGQWSPSRFYSLEAGYGNNKHVSVQFNPSANLTSHVTYRYKDVGLNSGSSWDANINYRNAQASVGFNYAQETTSVQQILAQQNVFQDFQQGGLSGNTNDPLALDTTLVNLSNDVVISKRATLSFNYRSGKSSYSASVYNQRRTYELSPLEDNIYGASGSWSWQFQPRLSLYLRPNWQSIDNHSVKNDRYDVALGLTRAIPINLGRPLMLNTRIEFRHIDQKSDLITNDYTENRATASFAVLF